MQPVLVYTDGSCRGNPGNGGWAYKVIWPDCEFMHGDTMGYTTNNIAEAMAVLQALRDIRLTPNMPLVIHTDSQYVLKNIARIQNRKPISVHTK